jgi:hypothetical protein
LELKQIRVKLGIEETAAQSLTRWWTRRIRWSIGGRTAPGPMPQILVYAVWMCIRRSLENLFRLAMLGKVNRYTRKPERRGSPRGSPNPEVPPEVPQEVSLRGPGVGTGMAENPPYVILRSRG